jgi:prepilin-type N-terminal cleavage/methylation domain-containing protein
MGKKNFFENKGGFTAVEMLVALGIVSILLLAINSVFVITKRATVTNEVAVEVMQALRTSMDFMEQDIRMAGLDRFGLAGAGVEVATATIFRFTSDRNMDDDIDDADLERITYSYDTANKRLRQCLYEGTGADSWEMVAENVDNVQFTFLDAAEIVLPTPVGAADRPEIRTVIVTMTVQRPASRFGPVTRTLTKRIIARNLGF